MDFYGAPIFLADEVKTLEFGGLLAANLRAGDCLCLFGDLGAGKSTLARGIIKALCGPETEVPSPTFTLVQQYDTTFGPLLHYDLYRLEDPDEVFELGFDELATAISLIEWPQMAGPHLPAQRIEIHLSTNGHGRDIKFFSIGKDLTHWR